MHDLSKSVVCVDEKSRVGLGEMGKNYWLCLCWCWHCTCGVKCRVLATFSLIKSRKAIRNECGLQYICRQGAGDEQFTNYGVNCQEAPGTNDLIYDHEIWRDSLTPSQPHQLTPGHHSYIFIKTKMPSDHLTSIAAVNEFINSSTRDRFSGLPAISYTGWKRHQESRTITHVKGSRFYVDVFYSVLSAAGHIMYYICYREVSKCMFRICTSIDSFIRYKYGVAQGTPLAAITMISLLAALLLGSGGLFIVTLDGSSPSLSRAEWPWSAVAATAAAAVSCSRIFTLVQTRSWKRWGITIWGLNAQ